jgi:pimeloyl-ACP methyl ester carboxylesterase
MAQVGTTPIRLVDGRQLRLEVAGDVSGRPIAVHNGTPNSRLLYGPAVEDARAKGAYLVSWDRPGYGGSSPQPGRTVADVAADMRAVADALGVDRLVTWGISGGGPHALACAALLPDLVAGAAVLGSLAPLDAEGLDYFDRMGQGNVDDIQLYLSDPEAARAKCREDWGEFRCATPDQLAEGMAAQVSPVDREALTGELADWLVSYMRDGLSPGDQGWWDDGVAHCQPWGFDLASVRVPTKVWHGHQDRFVPVGHGRWLAEHVAGAEHDIAEADGHLTLLQRIGDVHTWLLSRW